MEKRSKLLYELKLLVKTPCKDSSNYEVKYMLEGSKGSRIWGRRLSGRKTKLSSLIALIYSDVTSFPI